MAAIGKCIQLMDEGIGRVHESLPDMPASEAKLSRLMLIVGTRLEQELEATLKPCKLNHSEFLTLMVLYSAPNGSSTPGELCNHASQRATNMTRIGNALVKRGLILRVASEEDRRRVQMRITDEGRCFVQSLLPKLFPRVIAMFLGFDGSEKSQLSRLLRKLAHNLDQLEENLSS
jgi:MarR family transcriptional regulator, negative regulator of the multidrug operon emrRAB